MKIIADLEMKLDLLKVEKLQTQTGNGRQKTEDRRNEFSKFSSGKQFGLVYEYNTSINVSLILNVQFSNLMHKMAELDKVERSKQGAPTEVGLY